MRPLVPALCLLLLVPLAQAEIFPRGECVSSAVAQGCFADRDFGPDPACDTSDGSVSQTGVDARGAPGWHLSATGFDNRCERIGGHDEGQGIGLLVDAGATHVFATWQSHDGPPEAGNDSCVVRLEVGNDAFVAPCPLPPPNPGWGHVLP